MRSGVAKFNVLRFSESKQKYGHLDIQYFFQTEK